MRRIALTLATSMAVFAPALAEEPPKVPPDVEVLFPRGAEACYSARFRKDALRSGQTLTEFYLYRLFEPDPRQEEVALPRERAMALDKTSDLEKTVDVLARFTDSPEAFSQTVLCTYAEYGKSPITCYVECDGGSFRLDRAGDDAAITFSGEASLSLNRSCDEPVEELAEADRWLSAREAGGYFTATKADPALCLVAARSAHPKFAEDLVPLRERISRDGWRCLTRVYDQSHLASHPQQMVTSMALAIREPAKATIEEGDYVVTSLQTTLSFRLRDGRTVQGNSECSAMGYEFVCDTFRLRRRDASSALLVAGDFSDPDQPAVMLNTELGDDDRSFRLDVVSDAKCSIE